MTAYDAMSTKKVDWTPDQESAIRSRHANLLVSAAAGSGKTAVLVERILRLVSEDRVPIRQMLIVTFTNAAAGEMRTRIIQELAKKMRAPGTDVQWLRTQLEKAGSAYIMTLHAFCNDLVRKHFYKVDMDPAFKVGDATLLKTLRQEAVAETLESAYAQGTADFIHFIEAFSGNRTDERIEDLLWEVHGFIQSQPEPMEWLRAQTESLGAETAEGSPWLKALLAMLTEELEGLVNTHRETADLCLDPGGPAPYLTAINADLDHLENLISAVREGYAQAYKALQDFGFDKLKPIRSAEGEVDPALKEGVQKRRELVKKYIKRLESHFFAQSPEALNASIRRLLPATRALAALVTRLDEIYRDLKREANVIDFYDLEHLAIRILKDDTIAAQYREKFEHIFLDEYQDSNLVQETVIQAIARKNNVFLVGDVKQSIYKFRLADPTLFMGKLNRYSRSEDAPERIIDLSANFRTRPELLERINGFFETVMSLSLGEVVYDRHARLNPGQAFPEEIQPSLSLTLVSTAMNGSGETAASEAVQEGRVLSPDGDRLVNGEEIPASDTEADEALAYMKNAEIEAHIVAQMIRSTLKTMVYDPKRQASRMPSFRDVVILMRSPKGAAETFVRVLSQYGLPVRADGVGAKVSSFEMQAVLSLLKLIDNSRLDLDLLTVLRSPVGGFDAQDLARVRQSKPEASFRDAAAELAARAGGEAFRSTEEAALSLRLNDFFTRLQRWADTGNLMRMGDFVWALLMETGLLDYARAMPEGELRAAQLMKLVERAAEYEASIKGDLAGFIKVLEEGDPGEFGAEVPKNLGADEDYVRIMSIHKSKGLEFPIVFLADTGKKFNMRDTFGDLLLHKDLGIALKEVDPERRVYRTSLPQLAIQKAIEREALSEELRILYVALTRAVDRLMVTGVTKYPDRALENFRQGCHAFAMQQARTPLDWLGAYALGESSQSSWPWGFEVVEGLQRIQSHQTGDDQERSVEVLLSATRKIQLDPTLIQRLEGSEAYAGTGEEALLPSKVSVTALKALEAAPSALNRDQALELLFKPELSQSPRFMRQDFGKGWGAERGSAFHRLMQHLSLEALAQTMPSERPAKFEEEKARLLSQGILEAEMSSVLKYSDLAAFFEHPLFERMMAAKRLEREKPFILRRGEGPDFSMIQGVIDLYFEEEDGLVLVDYKTDRLDRETAPQVMPHRYGAQLALYAQALKRLTGKPVNSAWLYAAHTGQWIPMPISGAEA